MKNLTHQDRLRFVETSLQGLSVGDAFGEQFFVSHDRVDDLIRGRKLRPAPWPVTDDTVMAMSIVDVLAACKRIDCDLLATLFGRRYRIDPARGYGGTAHGILSRLATGEPWHQVSRSVYDGAGSMGNGGAMRAAPIRNAGGTDAILGIDELGAWFVRLNEPVPEDSKQGAKTAQDSQLGMPRRHGTLGWERSRFRAAAT